MPSKYMGAIMLGNGYSAIFISILRAICLLAVPEEKEFLSSLIYFIIASLVMVGSAIAHLRF